MGSSGWFWVIPGRSLEKSIYQAWLCTKFNGKMNEMREFLFLHFTGINYFNFFWRG